MRRQLIFSISIATFLLIATIGLVSYGRGYRFNFNGGKPDFLGTGLLVVTSKPDGAQVFVNGHLTTATDNTINLSPGDYTIRIFKDGYFPWEKKIKIQKEVVAKTDALLFPTAPKLESITNSGVRKPILDPSGTRLAYAEASQSARKNGIYILDLSTRPILTLQSSSQQITDDTADQFSNSNFSFSPDGSELIATTSAQTSYLLDSRTFNASPRDVTATLASVDFSWNKEKSDREKAIMDSLTKELRKLIQDNFKVLEWSLDNSKVIYQASTSAQLPIVINPRLIGTNTSPEQRKLDKGGIYVYDVKQDQNYKVDVKQPQNLHFFPDADHLIYVADQKIDIMEYDGGNRTTIYAGPFEDSYAFPWPDSSKIVILTNLGNPTIAPNLYTIVLK
ncbi:MAG TPA: PEGA domain-containing protein [Patescibacteria group bacterium]|nr:PEGA domain-containing protein [Patescibacteria group bacterium]